MDEDFCRERGQRIRALAECADPFTRRRLLALVGRYDAMAAGPSRSPRSAELPVRRPPPASTFSATGQA
ncbi:MAG: hypothetical protein E6614_02440 [Bradyrhizobium sp.]|nr:hypothetical protein [Bradyrhizobium sp.]